MFNNSNKSDSENISNSSNIISIDTVIEGNITADGNIRVEGKLIGNITTKAKVVLGDQSNVNGKIIAKNAEIAGFHEGLLEISELLTLKSTAKVNGDIITNKLVFEKGASFNGKCSMTEEVKLTKNTKKIDGVQAVQ